MSCSGERAACRVRWIGCEVGMDEFPVASGKLPVKGSLATTATFCQRLPELVGLQPGELFASSATPDCWNSTRVRRHPDCDRSHVPADVGRDQRKLKRQSVRNFMSHTCRSDTHLAGRSLPEVLRRGPIFKVRNRCGANQLRFSTAKVAGEVASSVVYGTWHFRDSKTDIIDIKPASRLSLGKPIRCVVS